VSYSVYIKRPNGSIPYEDWLAAARADPELVEDGESQWLRPDGGTETFAVFTWQQPAIDDDGDDEPEPAELVYYDGHITIDHADERWMKKLAALAAGLDAIVTGDDGETYDSEGRSDQAPKAKAGWLRRLFG
jgi:hypothetical protein